MTLNPLYRIYVILKLDLYLSTSHSMFALIVHVLYIWRVSEASETLSGVTQLKIGDICLYICLDVHMSFLYFDPGVFVLSGGRPSPKLH